MEFLKKKVATLVTNIIPKKHSSAQLPPALLKQLLSDASEGVDEQGLQRLAAHSYDPQNYPIILEQLVKALQSFTFTLKAERAVAKALTVATYLVKVGNGSFLGDLRKAQAILSNLQGVDVHHFQSSHPSEKKELEYRLQLIKQRALFLRRLLEDERLLEEERGKMPRCVEMQESQSESFTVHSLVTPIGSPQRTYKVKFSGGNPASKVEDHPFQLADGPQRARTDRQSYK